MSTHSKLPKKRRGGGVSREEKIVGLVIVFFAIWIVYSLSQPALPETVTTTTPTTATTATAAPLAPDFTLPRVGPNGLTGEKVSLSSFRGKVVLLEFMVYWCPHCQGMAPVLETLYEKFGPENVVFLSVAAGGAAWYGATADDAASFIRYYHTTWIYTYDSSASVFSEYNVSTTPNYFLITKSGQIAVVYRSEVASEILAADLTRLNA